MKKHDRFHLTYAVLAACTLVVLLMCTACCEVNDSILGTWKMENAWSSDGSGNDLIRMVKTIQYYCGSCTMTFEADGTGIINMKIRGTERSGGFEYQVRGNSMILDGSEVSFTIIQDTLTITGDGTTLTLVRR